MAAQRAAHLAPPVSQQPFGPCLRLACRRYETALRQNNAVDFDDLLGLTVALLRALPAVRERYLRRFRCGAVWSSGAAAGAGLCMLQMQEQCAASAAAHAARCRPS